MTQKLEFTISIDIRTAIGCGQLFLVQGQDPSTFSPDSVIGAALDSLIVWLEKQRQIPEVKDDLAITYAQLFKIDAMIPPASSGLDFSALGDELKTKLGGEPQVMADDTIEPDSFKQTKDIVATVEQRVQEKQLEGTKRDTTPVETPDIVDPPVDLEKVNRMSIENLAKLAPKDVLIEKCTKGIVDKVYTMAVEAVYTNLSLELWGTQTAEEAVNDLVTKHKRSHA